MGVSWLPLYHDMGLIGAWLNCLHNGLPLTLMPPTAFLARPERWLWAIHERRATLSAAPNFAYELCARRIGDDALEGLDLSSWRVALNGAEPVSPGRSSASRAASRPTASGPSAMTPVYGLAECSVALAFPPIGRGPRVDRIAREPFQREGLARPAAPGDTAALEFVSAGRELPEHEIRILDDAGSDVAERVVGRLAFRGPSMTSGYYRNPEATAAITLPGGWLDSGDLAYRADGEIHICGRRKDLIIKGGRNLVPQEIEEAAAGVEGIRRGCVVAFGVANATLGTEALVIVAETRATDPLERERLASAVTERVAAAVEVPPDEVVLVPPGAVLKTSSGKVRRAATKEQFVQGALGSGAADDARPEGAARPRGRGRAGAAAGRAARGGRSTPPGSRSRCRRCCCRSGRWSRSCRAAASASRSRASPRARACGSWAAASRPRASSGCRARGRWCSPATTPPTPTSRRWSRCCRSTCCSWRSARCSATRSCRASSAAAGT